VLDILDYCIEDRDTGVIGLAIEALANGARFRTLVEKAAARGKPIVALKIGRSPVGVGAALAHSSRLAGGARAYDALFAACGVAGVRSVEALAATCALLAQQPQRSNDQRLIAVTTSGAGGALIADHAAERGFGLAGGPTGEWDGAACAAVAAMNARGHLRNPIDLGSLADWVELDRIYQLLEADGLVGPSVVYAHVAPSPDMDETLLAVLRRRKARTGSAIVVVAPDGLGPDLERQYRDAGLALFHETVLAFDALAAHRAAGDAARCTGEIAPSHAARTAAARLTATTGAVLSEAESAEILRAAGVPMVEGRDATSLTQARAAAVALGYPVVLKAMVPGIAHKNAAGLVITSLSNQTELERAHATLMARTQGKTGVTMLLQPMVPAQCELIVGVAREGGLGHFLVFGLGGINAEPFDQVLLLPIELDVSAMRDRIAASRPGALLRALSRTDRSVFDQLSAILTALRQLVGAAGAEIESIDLNPIIVTNSNDLVAVDALIVRRKLPLPGP